MVKYNQIKIKAATACLTAILLAITLSGCHNTKPPKIPEQPTHHAQHITMKQNGYSIFMHSCVFRDGWVYDRYLVDNAKKLLKSFQKKTHGLFVDYGFGSPKRVRAPYLCRKPLEGEEQHHWMNHLYSLSYISDSFPYFLDNAISEKPLLHEALGLFECLMDKKKSDEQFMVGEQCNKPIEARHITALTTYFNASQIVYVDIENIETTQNSHKPDPYIADTIEAKIVDLDQRQVVYTKTKRSTDYGPIPHCLPSMKDRNYNHVDHALFGFLCL